MGVRSPAARLVATLTGCALLAAPAYADPGTTGGAAPLTVARGYGPTATALADGRVLVVGGDGPGSPGRAEVYDPAADSWTQTAAHSGERRTGHTATRLADGRVLVVGGRDTVTRSGLRPGLDRRRARDLAKVGAGRRARTFARSRRSGQVPAPVPWDS